MIQNGPDVGTPNMIIEAFSAGDEQILVKWRKIVEDYSSHRLSYEKDIFPALQGISKRFYEYR